MFTYLPFYQSPEDVYTLYNFSLSFPWLHSAREMTLKSSGNNSGD